MAAQNCSLYIAIFSLLLANGGVKAANIPQFGDIIRNFDGSVRRMSQSSEYLKSIGSPLENGELGALEYCATQGQHLPSVREFAQFATSLGARGIIDVSQATDKHQHLIEFNEFINFISPGGAPDEFYFNYMGYKRPAGDLGNSFFWSSTSTPGPYPDKTRSYVGYNFNSKEGVIERDIREYKNAVRCVEGQ